MGQLAHGGVDAFRGTCSRFTTSEQPASQQQQRELGREATHTSSVAGGWTRQTPPQAYGEDEHLEPRAAHAEWCPSPRT